MARLAASPTDNDEVKMDVQKGSGTKDTSGNFQCELSHFSSSTKTPFIKHGLKIYYSNQNTLVFIIKCLITNVIEEPSTIWRWDQVQGCDFIIIR